MSLIQKQIKQRQRLQRVKELMRSGEFKEAQDALARLPDTPEVEKLRALVDKRLYVRTGAMPVLGDSPVADSRTVAEQVQVELAQGTPVLKRRRVQIPNYPTLKAVSITLYFLGIVGLILGIILLFVPPREFEIFDQTYTQFFIIEGAILIGSGLSLVISGEVLRVYRDIARNTAITAKLLERLAESD